MRRKFLITLGYISFFIFAFLFSLYLTFDPGQIKAWLGNKANKIGINLDISRLDKYRLTGVRARGVTIKTKGGQTIKIDQVKARLSLLPLIIGRKKIGIQLAMSEGKFSGKFEPSSRGYKTKFKVQKINLANLPLGNQGGFWISAPISGKGNLNLTPKDNPRAWSGKIHTELGPGKIPSFNYRGFNVPEVKVDQAKLDLELNNGNAQIKSLELLSPDFPLQGNGQIELRAPIQNSLLQLSAKVNPSQQYLGQIPMLQSLLPSDRTVTYRGTIAGIISGIISGY